MVFITTIFILSLCHCQVCILDILLKILLFCSFHRKEGDNEFMNIIMKEINDPVSFSTCTFRCFKHFFVKSNRES